MPKILIVEDDQKLALAISTRLKAAGYEVVAASDALMGVTAATKHKPDLVLLDIAMPLGGGFSVAERLKNLADTANTPIIFITAGRDPNLRTRALEEYGAAGYIEKPFEASDLLAMIEKALSPHYSGTDEGDLLG